MVLGTTSPVRSSRSHRCRDEQQVRQHAQKHGANPIENPARVPLPSPTACQANRQEPDDDQHQHRGHKPLLPAGVAQLAEPDPDGIEHAGLGVLLTFLVTYMNRQMIPAPMNEIAMGKIIDLAMFSPLAPVGQHGDGEPECRSQRCDHEDPPQVVDQRSANGREDRAARGRIEQDRDHRAGQSGERLPSSSPSDNADHERNTHDGDADPQSRLPISQSNQSVASTNSSVTAGRREKMTSP